MIMSNVDNETVQNDQLNEIKLKGCSPVPLAHYLKALGVFRIISEQKDRNAQAYWKNDCFYLKTTLNNEQIISFLLEEYKPTPIVAPWHGGSGFSPKDKSASEVMKKIEQTNSEKFDEYKKVIQLAKLARKELKIDKKVPLEKKKDLLSICRNTFPDNSLKWLDAAFVLTSSNPKYPSMLGTGGLDLRLDFSSNYMKNIYTQLIDLKSNEDVKKMFIENSLYGLHINNLQSKKIGQFLPNAAGGVNAMAGFESDSLINPWDYILMMEGALLFASSCTRKHNNNSGTMITYPFSVKPTSFGYGTKSLDDQDFQKSNDEIWMPLWNKSVSLMELASIFSEGRATIGKRFARNGVDFVRAIAMLGIDRGINEFQRYGFFTRNGRAHFATPIGRFKVQRKPDADLIMEIDSWLDRFRYKCTREDTPASFVRAVNNLDRSMMDICKKEGPAIVQNLLIDLGRCERTMANSLAWTEKSYLQPVPLLSSKWLEKADDGSVEFRLAAALASVYGKYGNRFISLRYNLEPSKTSKGSVWWDTEGNKDAVPAKNDLVKHLNSMMERRLITAQQNKTDSYPDIGKITAELGDISDLLEGRCDENKLLNLLWGLVLIDWVSIDKPKITRRSDENSLMPGSDYSVMKLCYHNWFEDEYSIPLNPQIHRKASRGEGYRALEYSIRRLRGSGIEPAIAPFPISQSRSRRVAAALLFPISTNSARRIKRYITRPKETKEE